MKNKKDKETLIPIIVELELAIDKIKPKNNFSKKQIEKLETALLNLKEVLGEPFTEPNRYEIEKARYLSVKGIDEIIVLMSETENKCAKIEKNEKDGNFKNNKENEPSEAYKRMHAAINIDSLIQIKNALITGCNNWITIDDIPRNNGKLYQKFYDKNDNIEYNMIWDTLIKKFHPISDDDYYNDKFKYKLSNILRGNRKNIEPDLWNDMLKCLLYLSNTDEKNPQQYFYSQFMSYLKDKIDPLELPILPDLDGAIAEYNQKKKQEQSGN